MSGNECRTYLGVQVHGGRFHRETASPQHYPISHTAISEGTNVIQRSTSSHASVSATFRRLRLWSGSRALGNRQQVEASNDPAFGTTGAKAARCSGVADALSPVAAGAGCVPPNEALSAHTLPPKQFGATPQNTDRSAAACWRPRRLPPSLRHYGCASPTSPLRALLRRETHGACWARCSAPLGEPGIVAAAACGLLGYREVLSSAVLPPRRRGIHEAGASRRTTDVSESLVSRSSRTMTPMHVTVGALIEVRTLSHFSPPPHTSRPQRITITHAHRKRHRVSPVAGTTPTMPGPNALRMAADRPFPAHRGGECGGCRSRADYQRRNVIHVADREPETAQHSSSTRRALALAGHEQAAAWLVLTR